MALIFNGITLPSNGVVKFNSKEVRNIIFNGVECWVKATSFDTGTRSGYQNTISIPLPVVSSREFNVNVTVSEKNQVSSGGSQQTLVYINGVHYVSASNTTVTTTIKLPANTSKLDISFPTVNGGNWNSDTNSGPAYCRIWGDVL